MTYHKTLTYFLNRFAIKNEVFLEPKPGIPPTATHLIEVVNLIKARKIPLVLIENYFDLSAGKRVAAEVSGVRVSLCRSLLAEPRNQKARRFVRGPC